MDVILDACSIINLVNSGHWGCVVSLRRCELWLSPVVVGECGVDVFDHIFSKRTSPRVKLMDSRSIPGERYLGLLEEHGLGEGETECLAVAEQYGHFVCCEDRKARRIIAAALGEERVLGSLRLLRWCVEDGILKCDHAYNASAEMRARGGFLPDPGQEYFCSAR